MEETAATPRPCSVMDIQIFNLHLPVMTTSAYILIAALMTDGVKPSMSAIRDRWNAVPEALEQALLDLVAHNIIEKHPGPDGIPVYIANPASLWAHSNGGA